MFQPRIFNETRREELHTLMKAHPFATVISAVAGQLCADHLPLVLHTGTGAHGSLKGHVAAANPISKHKVESIDVLAVFHGPAGYVSPGWYPSKQEHGKAVPTWNYVTVHAKGTLSFKRDREWKLQHLRELSNQFEGHRSDPWTIEQMPNEFLERQLKALVGFEIQIEELNGAVKLSQNKSSGDKAGVIVGLETEACQQARALSEYMAQMDSQNALNVGSRCAFGQAAQTLGEEDA